MLSPLLTFSSSLNYCMSLLTLPQTPLLPSSHSQLSNLSNPFKPECVTSLIKPPIYPQFTQNESHRSYKGLQSSCALDPIPAHHHSVLTFCLLSTSPTWSLIVNIAGIDISHLLFFLPQALFLQISELTPSPI